LGEREMEMETEREIKTYGKIVTDIESALASVGCRLYDVSIGASGKIIIEALSKDALSFTQASFQELPLEESR
jgi:hypothetical protein